MTNDTFLDAFKGLDAELKAEGTSVLEFEEKLDSEDKESLKVCRIMRNYMAHNTRKKFLATTKEQVDFLNGLTAEVRKKSHLVKDEVKKMKPVATTTPIKELLPAVVKFPIIPMETKSGIYLITVDIILKNLVDGNKKIDVPKTLPKYDTIDVNERMEEVAKGTYVVTSKDKFVGILIV